MAVVGGLGSRRPEAFEARPELVDLRAGGRRECRKLKGRRALCCECCRVGLQSQGELLKEGTLLNDAAHLGLICVICGRLQRQRRRYGHGGFGSCRLVRGRRARQAIGALLVVMVREKLQGKGGGEAARGASGSRGVGTRPQGWAAGVTGRLVAARPRPLAAAPPS
jgi:hypothetical protein